MTKIYTLILNSNDTTNLISKKGTGDATWANYWVDWQQIIPPEYKEKKFKVTFSLRSEAEDDANGQILYAFLYVNFGSTFSYTSKSTISNCLGTVNGIPQTQYIGGTPESIFRFIANAYDNVGIMSNYPSSSQVYVTFKGTNGTSNVAVFPDYALQLSFELME